MTQDDVNGWRGEVFAKGNLIACDNSVDMLCGSRYKSHVFVNKKKLECFHVNCPNQYNSWSLKVLWIKERTIFEIVGLLP